MMPLPAAEEAAVRLLTRYILRHIGPPAVLALAMVAFLAMIGGIREHLEDLPIDQITLGDLSRLSLLSLPALVAYIVPITFMMGILVAFAGFAHHNELVAMKAAGVSMKRVVLPVIVLGAVLSVACFLIIDQLKPWAVQRMTHLIYTELPQRASLAMLPPGVMHEFGGWRVYIGDKEADGEVLRDIVILQPGEAGGMSDFYADRARIEKVGGKSTVVLEDAFWIQTKGDDQVMHAASPRIELPVPRIEAEQEGTGREAMTSRELFARQRALSQELAQAHSVDVASDLVKVRDEIMDRVAYALMCLAISVVSAPLAAGVRRGGRSYVFGVASGILLVYFVLRSVVKTDVLMPLPTMIALGQTPNLVLSATGLILIFRLDRI